jgi:hypothetical protein
MVNMPRALGPLAHLRHQVGRRGYFLLTLAVIDVYYGYSFIHPDSPAIASQNSYMLDVIPLTSHAQALWVWAAGWWMTAAFCLVSAFRTNDRLGYGMAFSLKIAWISANALAGFDGMPGAFTRCVVWSFIASSVLVIAKWPEPRHSLPEVIAEISSTGELPRFGHHLDDGRANGPDQGLGQPPGRDLGRLRGHLRHEGEPSGDAGEP